MRNLLSIIILSYNNLHYIKETIDSSIQQDYDNIEIIIADDGTEDFDCDFFRRYMCEKCLANIKNIKIYRNDKNLGTVKNINKAINLSKGDYIKLIAADDSFYGQSSLSECVNFMIENKSEILMSNVLLCDNNMSILDQANKKKLLDKEILRLGIKPKEFFNILAIENVVSAPGVFFKRTFFERYGLFDEKYVLLEDWPMWLRLARNNVEIDFADIISVKYRTNTGVSSSANINPILKEDIITCIKNEVIPYRDKLGYWQHKKIKFSFIRKYYFENYSALKKISFVFFHIDIIAINRLKLIISNR